MEFLVSDDFDPGNQRLQSRLGTGLTFDVWESEQKYTLYAKSLQHKAKKKE